MKNKQRWKGVRTKGASLLSRRRHERKSSYTSKAVYTITCMTLWMRLNQISRTILTCEGKWRGTLKMLVNRPAFKRTGWKIFSHSIRRDACITRQITLFFNVTESTKNCIFQSICILSSFPKEVKFLHASTFSFSINIQGHVKKYLSRKYCKYGILIYSIFSDIFLIQKFL